MTTALAPVSDGIIALARDDRVSLEALAEVLLPAAGPEDQSAVPFPALPKDVELTPAARAALAKVEDVFGSVSIKDRRSLTEAEVGRISDEAEVLAILEKALKARLEYIREVMRVHMDVAAEESNQAVPKARRGVSPTPRTPKGHYLLATAQNAWEIAVGGFRKGWQQVYVPGKAVVAPSPDLLHDLREKDLITQREYLAMTRVARPFDPDKMLAFIRKNPSRGPAILRLLTTRDEPNAQVHLPER